MATRLRDRIDDEQGFRRSGGPGPHALRNQSSENEDGLESNALPGNPHSQYGFRRAIKESQNRGRLVDLVRSGKRPMPVNRLFQQAGPSRPGSYRPDEGALPASFHAGRFGGGRVFGRSASSGGRL